MGEQNQIARSKGKASNTNRVLKDGSEVRYDLPLYRQITEASNSRLFSKPV